MLVTARAAYACLAMLELAARYGDPKPVRIADVTDKHRIPQRFLVQILLQFKGAGYVASSRGALGGYLLTMPPEEISLSDIMTAIDGPLPNQHDPVTSPRSPATLAICSVWNEVLAGERSLLQQATFAELVKRIKQPAGEMYYI